MKLEDLDKAIFTAKVEIVMPGDWGYETKKTKENVEYLMSLLKNRLPDGTVVKVSVSKKKKEVDQ